MHSHILLFSNKKMSVGLSCSVLSKDAFSCKDKAGYRPFEEHRLCLFRFPPHSFRFFVFFVRVDILALLCEVLRIEPLFSFLFAAFHNLIFFAKIIVRHVSRRRNGLIQRWFFLYLDRSSGLSTTSFAIWGIGIFPFYCDFRVCPLSFTVLLKGAFLCTSGSHLHIYRAFLLSGPNNLCCFYSYLRSFTPPFFF